jgi:two-component system cell cycle sensor histidine kinase/response regulator CckA
VLIAEDDDLVLQFARDVLGSSGFTVLVSRNGAEALEVASRARIDALLTDVVMAPMDGLELAETLRLQRPGLPVVFMSGHTHDDRAREQAAATGGLFLSKPFSSRDLVQHVRVALQRSP